MNQELRGRSSSVSNADCTFTKSRKTERSPIAKRKEPDNMEEEIIKTLMELRKEMKEMRKENTELRQEMRKENIELRQEIKNQNATLKTLTEQIKSDWEQWKEKEKKWEEDRMDLSYRVEQLENREEQKERRSRKNNIIVKGKEMKWEEPKQEIAEFIKAELGLKVKIEDTYKIKQKNGKEIIMAKLSTWEEKANIMKNKHKLNGSRVYIDNDMTVKERQIQMKLKDMAEKEKERGNKVKVAYKKIQINGKWFTWDVAQGKPVESKIDTAKF